MCVLALGSPAWGQDAVSSAGARRAAPTRVGVATVFADDTPWARQLRWLAREVERATEGQVVLRVQVGERRGGEPGLLERVRRGELAGALVTADYLIGDVPALAVVQGPFLFRSYAEADAVLDAVVREAVDRQLAAVGLAMGGWGEAGFHVLATSGRPVVLGEALGGARLWTRPCEWNWPSWRALGVRVTDVPAAEVGAALESSRVQVLADSPWRIVYGSWHRHIDHVALTGHRYEPLVLVWNRAFWQSLPAGARAIVEQRGRLAAGLGRRLVRGLSGDLRRIFERENVATHVPSALERAAWEDATRAARMQVAAQYGEDMVELLRAIESATRALR